MISFVEKSTFGRGNHIQVTRVMQAPPAGGSRPVTIGWIGEGRDGSFLYFEPDTNELNPRLVAQDLEELKKQIENLYK